MVHYLSFKKNTGSNFDPRGFEILWMTRSSASPLPEGPQVFFLQDRKRIIFFFSFFFFKTKKIQHNREDCFF